jgi:translocation and assembly module TamB
VTGGTLTVRDADRSRERTLTGVEGEVTIPAATAESVVVKVRSETGKLDADLTVGAEIAGKLTAADFPLDVIEPFARRADPGLTLAGTLSADLTAGVTPSESGLPDSRVAGTVSARELVITSPRLGPEPLSLRRVELPCAATTKGTEVRVEKASLTCELGSASFAGTLDLAEPVEKWIDRPGLKATADADVAALAARFPKLLRIRDGLELREGRVRAELASTPGPGGPAWVGSVKTTALKGVRGGKPLAWDQPVEVAFAGRLGPTRVPAFDRLDVKAEFATVTARGSPERFTADADVSLDKLAARLSEFIDLGGVTLAGTAKVGLTYTPNGRGGATLRGNTRLTKFAYADGTRQLREPELVLDVMADGRFDAETPVRLETGRLTLTAGADVLDVRLLEPVADVRALRSGKVAAEAAGDLGRWRDRATRFVSIPAGWQVAGTGKAAGTVRFDAARIALEKVAGELTALKFAGAGLRIDEPQVKVYPTDVAIDRASGRVEVGELQAATQTIGLSTRRVVLTPSAGGGYAVACTVLANANLARLQRTLQLQSDPRQSDAVAGLVQAGTVTLDTAGGRYRFKVALPVSNFAYGPPQNPTWAEPKLTVAADGEYDPAADLLRFDAMKVERPAALSAQAKGTIGRLSSAQDLNLDGKISYDLSLLEPQLRGYLGQGVKAVGKETRDFRVSGPLSAGAENLSASVAGLSGSAAVAWQSLRAYGFDVGKSELKATLDKGTVRFAPVEAAFGQTGKVRLEPSVRLARSGYDLTFAKGKVVERAKLTPAACADALGYALPAIAKSTQAEGLVSFDLDENTVPLADPDRATVRGKLTLHQVQVGPGPVVTEIATLFGAKQTKLTLADEQVVPVRLENGRVHHEGMSLTANGFALRTTGSVGLDGSLDLLAEVPVPETAVAQVLKNNPRIREAIAKKRFSVPVGGTVSKPRLDPRAFQDAVRRYAEEVAREAARNKLNDVIEKGQGELEKELQKKLDKFLPLPKQPPPKKE